MTTPAPDSAKTPDAADVLLRVRDLRVAFDTFAGSVHALDGVELEVRRGETLGLVGESGCGKSGTALAVMRLLAAPPARLEGGEVVLAFRVPARPRPGSEAASAARLPDDEPLVDGIARVVRERLDLSGRDPPRRGRPTPPERHRARLVARAALRAIGVPESADSAWRTPGTMSPAERALAERALAWALTPRDSYEVDLLALDEDEMQHVRGNDVAMIFQEPMTSLNPVLRVGEQIAEAVLRHESFAPDGGVLGRVLGRAGLSAPGARERERRAWDAAARMLGTIGFPEPAEALERYPHELSGGMRQRVMIAMALATHPDLLIADEPTTALDVTIQAQIMQLLKELKEASGASLLLITHHLGVVAEMCDRVSVMYAGQVVETAATRDLFQRPAHPYTLALLKSVPDLAADAGDLPVIPGAVPDLLRPPHGCRFHPRCPYAIARCSEERPKAADLGGGHRVACHLWSAPEASLPPELAAAAAATEAPAAKGAPAPDPAAGAGRATGVA